MEMVRILSVIVVLMWAAAGFAAAQGDSFGGLDRDKSGTLEQAEIEGGAAQVFRKADKSGDGALDQKEFTAAGGKRLRFDEIDTDKNGRIDLNEFRAAAMKRFQELDRNGDGRIDSQEIRPRQKAIVNPLFQFFF